MKTFLKILTAFSLLGVVVAGFAYIVVTRPSFQKNLIEKNLPEGSSLKQVQITAGSVELVELELQLNDGTRVKVARLNSGFSPLSALFQNTIQLEGLALDGLLIELPVAVSETESEVDKSTAEVISTQNTQTKNKVNMKSERESSLEALYALGQMDWLFNIDSVNFNGELIDPSKNRFALNVVSGEITPGVTSELEASLKLESSEAMQGGLKDCVSDIRVKFSQNTDGGFEKINISSQTLGCDTSGANLVSASQTLELTIDSSEETAVLAFGFNLDLPRPEIFASGFKALGDLSVRGGLSAAADRDAITLTKADLDLASNRANVASIKLKQSLNFGAQQEFSGELMEVDLFNLPMDWISPWLGDGTEVWGAPLSAEIALLGQGDGGLKVVTRQSIEIGPLSISRGGCPLLDNVTVRMNPVIDFDADGKMSYDLGDFQLLDQYGKVVVGSISGSQTESAAGSLLAGLQAEVRLNVGLSELFNQPALAGKASFLAGQANIQLDIDGASEYPTKLQAVLTGLRARNMPGSRQDYRIAAELKQSNSGRLTLSSNLEAGSENRPSTRLQLAGQVNPEQEPKPFTVSLKSAKISQRDIELLFAALKSNYSNQKQLLPAYNKPWPREKSALGITPTLTKKNSVEPSPWAELDGSIDIQINEFMLRSGHLVQGLSAAADISGSEITVDGIKASLDQSTIEGNVKVSYNSGDQELYQINSSLSFDNFDPSVISKKRSATFPVQGLFNGHLEFQGLGATLEKAAENSTGEFSITGRDGLLTAFELDNRSQLGLLGVGLLGRHLDRPGMTAMTQAIPYFKDMRFEKFTLRLTRGIDKKLSIPELNFIGDNIRIMGQGSIAASDLSELLSQPLSLSIGLGAKGRLIDYLETLQLLSPKTSQDGFRKWKSDINIGGTLGNPDSSALEKLLSDAASRALKEKKPNKSQTDNTQGEGQMVLPGQGQAVEQQEPPKKSSEEKLIDDIEMGLDLFNTFFGN